MTERSTEEVASGVTGRAAQRAASSWTATPGQTFRKNPAWSNHIEVPEPVADQRLSGEHWWDPDRIAHMDDEPQHCPACGATLADSTGSIAVEYWEGDRRTYHTRCGGCGWSGDITKVERMVGHEPPH